MKDNDEIPLHFTPRYLDAARLASYACQFSEVMALEPATVLEVGAGSGVLAFMLRQAGVRVTTLDLDDALQPDIVASVTGMPVPDGAFDLVACFEVLEHIPFEDFRSALREIRRASRGDAVLSLPDRNRFYKAEFVLPKLGRRRLSWDVPYRRPPDVVPGSEHMWEINRKGYPLDAILGAMREEGFLVTKTYRLWEHPFHRFFVLKKQT